MEILLNKGEKRLSINDVSKAYRELGKAAFAVWLYYMEYGEFNANNIKKIYGISNASCFNGLKELRSKHYLEEQTEEEDSRDTLKALEASMEFNIKQQQAGFEQLGHSKYWKKKSG